MKVILQKDVARLGKKYQEVEVSDGYALNRLIPGGLAVAANRASRGRIAKRAAQTAVAEEAAVTRLHTAAAVLQAQPLQVMVAANEQGGLFQGLDKTAIIEAAQQQGVLLDETMIVLPDAVIKHIGSHTIRLAAGNESVDINIEISATT